MLLKRIFLPLYCRDGEGLLRTRPYPSKATTCKTVLNRFPAPTKQLHREAAAVVVHVDHMQIHVDHCIIRKDVECPYHA